jgi:AcrR family transcriptional regulator
VVESVDVQRKAVKRKSVPAREPLSRERVVAAAMALADESGLDGLSMRSLARALGVEAMSLYHWFRNKNELLEGMMAAVFTEMGKPENTDDWRADMRGASVRAKDVLLRHRWAAKLMGEPMGLTRAQLEWMDGILGRLRSAGFSRNMTHHAYHALDSHIVGFVLWLLPVLEVSETWPDMANDVLAQFSDGSLPAFIEHVEEHMDPAPGEENVSEFEFGLDLLLNGLERIRVGEGTS